METDGNGRERRGPQVRAEVKVYLNDKAYDSIFYILNAHPMSSKNIQHFATSPNHIYKHCLNFLGSFNVPRGIQKLMRLVLGLGETFEGPEIIEMMVLGSSMRKSRID